MNWIIGHINFADTSSTGNFKDLDNSTTNVKKEKEIYEE